jgi:hypothetical protein
VHALIGYRGQQARPVMLKAFLPTSPRDFSTISSGNDVPIPDGQSDKKVDRVSIDLLIATIVRSYAHAICP